MVEKLATSYPTLSINKPLPLNSRTNLTLQFTSFIGREWEMTELERLFGQTRLLTLVGPGGVGKTRLATQAGLRLLPKFNGGVWLVDLTTVQDLDQITVSLARVLKIRKEAKRQILSTIVDTLQDRQFLLILDNCEHLLESCAQLAGTLLPVCPNLNMLVTSREALGIGGEQILRVSSLSLPPLVSMEKLEEISPDELAVQLQQSEAVQLLVQRAQAACSTFAITYKNASAIAHICRYLDGIPLALELAAARFPLLSAEQIAARLEQVFHLLGRGNRLALPHQRTLEATLDWSFKLLSPKEALLFHRLAVFVGDWNLEMAEQICCGRLENENQTLELKSREILDILASLVNKSLVLVEDTEQEARYHFQEIVRQYALEKLRQTREEDWLRAKVLDYALKLGRSISQEVVGKDAVLWLHNIRKTYPNLRAAFEWAIAQERWNQALLLASGLRIYWDQLDLVDGLEWLEKILSRTVHLGSTFERAQALFTLGYLAVCQPDYRKIALEPLQESLAIWQQLNHTQGIGLALSTLAYYAMSEMQCELAHDQLNRSILLLAQAGDRPNLLYAQYIKAFTHFMQDQHEPAREQVEHLLEEYQELDDAWMIARCLTMLSELARARENLALAERYSYEALGYFQALENTGMIAITYNNLAQIALAQGETGKALDLQLKAARLQERNQGSLACGLVCLGGIAFSLNQFPLAARIFGSLERYIEKYGVILQPLEKQLYSNVMAKVQACLDSASLAAAWSEGRKLAPGQAIVEVEKLEQALSLNNSTPITSTLRAREVAQAKSQGLPHSKLSEREREVLKLLACGSTNKRIAEALVISPKTVGRHLESIFNKLGVNSRSAATRYALEHHLA